MRYTWILVLVCVGLSCIGCSRGSGTPQTASEEVGQPVGAEPIDLDLLYNDEAEAFMPLPDLIHPAGDLARQMRESLETRFDRFDSLQWQRIDEMLTLLENPPRGYFHAVDRNERAILAKLTREMMQTGVTSLVTFTTAVDDAVVKYQAYGGTEIGTANGTTQDASVELPIGYYFFWTERNSQRNSDPLAKEIVRENEGPIPLQEYPDGR